MAHQPESTADASTVPSTLAARARSLEGLVHHALMLVAMVPCLTSLHDPGLHAASVVMLAALCGVSSWQTRRHGRDSHGLVDNLAMLVLVIAMLLIGHGEVGTATAHHGAGGGVSMAEGLAIAGAAGWLCGRVATWRSVHGAGARTSCLLAAAMVAWMLFAVLGG